MKTLYIDCFSGISGDMFLGALIDAGFNIDWLKKELKKLPLNGYAIKTSKTKKHNISATRFEVNVKGKQPERSLKEINLIINKSRLSPEIKTLSKKIFLRLAKAEAKIHNTSPNKIHFHEIGAVDSLIDIIGAAIAIKKLGIEKFYSSQPCIGSGFVKCSHGILPVPVPATLELLKGISLKQTNVKSELITPTGAAILSALTSSFGKMPKMQTETIGYGAGKKDFKEQPNVLRILIGEADYDTDTINLTETNIDDMNPEFYEYVIQRLLKAGALDAFVTPVHMKKNRPAAKLSVLSSPENLDRLSEIIFDETTSFGVRITDASRRKLKREFLNVKTKYGAAKVKVGLLGKKIKTIAPEYESCKKLAQKKKVPLKQVYKEAERQAEKLMVKVI